MATRKTVLSLDVQVDTEQREGYFASRTKPFAITVYAKTENEAEERAMDALTLLLKQYAKTPDELSGYLNRNHVKHLVSPEVDLQRSYPPPRICKKEMRLEVPASAC